MWTGVSFDLKKIRRLLASSESPNERNTSKAAQCIEGKDYSAVDFLSAKKSSFSAERGGRGDAVRPDYFVVYGRLAPFTLSETSFCVINTLKRNRPQNSVGMNANGILLDWQDGVGEYDGRLGCHPAHPHTGPGGQHGGDVPHQSAPQRAEVCFAIACALSLWADLLRWVSLSR